MNKYKFLVKSLACMLLAGLSFLTINLPVNADSGDIYVNISNSYDAAYAASNAINEQAEALNQIIAEFPADAITVENAENIASIIESWQADFGQVKDSFEATYNANWPLIIAYQEDLEQYNLSGFAPEGNITEGFYTETFNITEFLEDVEAISTENVNSALAYGNYYLAYNDYISAFEQYTAGWQLNNPGDPDNDFNNVWKPTVNSIYEMNFAPLGYTDQELSDMYSTEEYNSFIETYKTKGGEVIDKLAVYTDYLVSVSDELTAAKDVFENKLNEFNAATASNLIFMRRTDPLAIGARGALDGMQKAYDFNVDVLVTNIKGDDRSVYEHLSYLSQIRYAGVTSGQRSIESIVAPAYTALEFTGTIPMIEVYEPLVVETVDPPVTGVTPPSTEAPVLPQTGSNQLELMIAGIAFAFFGVLALKLGMSQQR